MATIDYADAKERWLQDATFSREYEALEDWYQAERARIRVESEERANQDTDKDGARGGMAKTVFGYDVPGYTRVLTVGSLGTERLLCGEVIVQEKVDGSQLSVGIGAEGVVGCRSHHKQIDSSDNMFDDAVNYVNAISPIIQEIWEQYQHGVITWYCEYLRTPRHNTLAYEHTPTNHLVLFDMRVDGQWMPRNVLEEQATRLGIDVIPELYRGVVSSIDDLKPLLEKKSYLGGTTVEGLVIKNYAELIAFGGGTYPLFCKLVNTGFKERNKTNWALQSNKNKLETYFDSFCTEARWAKAVQHLREKGALLYTSQDIGPLLREINTDIEEEEAENIKQELYQMFIKDIKQRATRGFPDWYKKQLIDNEARKQILEGK